MYGTKLNSFHHLFTIETKSNKKKYSSILGDVPSGECLAASTVLPYILKKPCTNSYPYICEYNPAQIGLF